MTRRLTWSTLARALSAATLLVALSAGSVFGGEVTGPPSDEGPFTHTPIGAAPDTDPHAGSICSFSGLNDGEDEPGRTAAHVQNWGQIPKAFRDEISMFGAHPGDACNGHTGIFAGGH